MSEESYRTQELSNQLKEIHGYMKDIHVFMGKQDAFGENTTLWMDKLEKKLDTLPSDCPTGKSVMRRLDKLEERPENGGSSKKNALFAAGSGVGGGGIIVGLYHLIKMLIEMHQ